MLQTDQGLLPSLQPHHLSFCLGCDTHTLVFNPTRYRMNICTVKGIQGKRLPSLCVRVHRMTVLFDVLFYMQDTEVAKFSVPRESTREFVQAGVRVTHNNLTEFDAMRILKQPYTVCVRKTVVDEDGDEEVEDALSDDTGTLSQVLRTLTAIGNDTMVDDINEFLNDKIAHVIESEAMIGGFNSASA